MDAYVAGVAIENRQWFDPTIAGSIFLFSLILAVVFNKLLYPIIVRITHWIPTEIDSKLLQATRLPLTFGIVVLGAFLALTVPLDLSNGQQQAVNSVAGALGIVLAVMGVASLVSIAFDWYVEHAPPSARQSMGERLLPLFRRVASVLVYGLGALMVLSHLGVSINPLIAGLGLGGLAVALAIQPTLANLFAGTYVMTEGVVAVGDYVELENGVAGYVVDVGWRSTRIRTWRHNLVVVPNSRFAETIITNYQQPTPAVNVIVDCGISYDSDLYHVEQVCREVMDEVLGTDPNAVKEYGGWFGYDSFGDSNVNFWLFVQAKSRFGGFGLKTALMERLHQRFNEEGIVINYPVRTLQFPEELGPEAIGARSQRQEVKARADARGVEGEGDDAPDLG